MTSHQTALKFVLALCLAAWVASSALAADETPDLQLKPCAIELVDGTEVEGKLAVQFEMDNHLIVYSPRLATMRSLMKEHVHALTVDGEREQLNPKRALTEEDRKLLGRVQWPDAPPAKGDKPPYTTEEWQKPKQLLVWANPGRTGRFENPDNWLVNGRPMDEWPRPRGNYFGLVFFKSGQVDFLFPSAESSYRVRPRRSNARTRHITVETGADAEISLNQSVGNLWVSEHGSFNGGGGASLTGSKDTFFVNGERYAGEAPTTPERFRELMKSAKYVARKWVVRKHDAQASMTLIGTFGSGDETHWMRGTTILTENSVISVGPRCTQTIGRNAKMVMESGAVLGKEGNQLYKPDMRVKGELQIGRPADPIQRSVYLGLSIKDPTGEYTSRQHALDNNGYLDALAVSRGLTVLPGGSIHIHAGDSGDASLVITWHGALGGGDDGTKPGYFDELPEFARTSTLNFYTDVQLEDVTLDRLGEGDIRMLNPDIRRKWKRVRFGKHLQSEPNELLAKIKVDSALQKELAKWRKKAREGVSKRVSLTGAGVLGKRYPRILPSGGTFAAGDTVKVRLEGLGDPTMRYTLDGSDSSEGKVYEQPIQLKGPGTVTVKAGLYQRLPLDFDQRWKELSETFRFVDGTRKPDEPGKTESGLMLKVYEDNDTLSRSLQERNELGKPSATMQIDALVLPEAEYRGSTGLVYTGHIEIKEGGTYRFETETGGKSRLFIGDHLVVNNHRRYNDDFRPDERQHIKPDLSAWGSLKLAPGKHAFRLEYFHKAWHESPKEVFHVRYQGPGVEKQPIPPDVLYRQRRWNAVITPGGGLREGGETVAVRMSVDTRADASDVSVRYTLDGTEPTARSAVYEAPLAIERDATVRARCFRDGEPLPGKAATAKFIFLGGLEDAKPGLVYRLYEGGWSALPDFDELDPADSGTAEQIGIDVTDRGSNFGLVFNGYLTVPAAGEYTFYTTSDDGSALSIDGKRVVDNDGAHGMQERSGTVTLSKGPHLIRVGYFQGGGGKGLEVHWSGPGIDKQSIPGEALSH